MDLTIKLFEISRKAFWIYADIRNPFSVGSTIDVYDGATIAFRFYIGNVFFTFGIRFNIKDRE